MVLEKLALTPALSRRERETVIQRSSSRARSILVRLDAVLPLPEGEGRGEGGRHDRPAAHFASISPFQFHRLVLIFLSFSFRPCE